MALNKKELEYFRNEMTWREFADDAGAKVLVRGIARGSSKKIQPKTLKKLQLRIVLAIADTGPKAMVQDALKVIRKVLAKNEPQIMNKVMAKNTEKTKVSKRLQMQVEASMADRAARAA
jgi:hypothetical protein